MTNFNLIFLLVDGEKLFWAKLSLSLLDTIYQNMFFESYFRDKRLNLYQDFLWNLFCSS
jgi:hypothetical protein